MFLPKVWCVLLGILRYAELAVCLCVYIPVMGSLRCNESLCFVSFRDYKEYHTDTTVKFTVKMSAEKLAQAEETGLHKVFKLQTSASTNTMVSLTLQFCLLE